MFIYNCNFDSITGESGAVLNVGANSRIYIRNVKINNVSASDNGGCFKMMTTEFIIKNSVITNIRY